MSADAPVLELVGVTKDYRGLRPLRIASLRVGDRERVALSGLDRPAAEVFVNLVNGAILPDQGEVRVFGAPTSAIRNDVEWLESLDRFGIVTERAVLLEGSTLAQNLALPFSIEIDPMPPDVRARVEALAHEAGLDPDALDRPVGGLSPGMRLRIHLARAVAVGPRLLLMEHPTISLGRDEVEGFARVVAAMATAHELTVVAITDDRAFAEAAGSVMLKLRAADGELTPVGGWLRWWR